MRVMVGGKPNGKHKTTKTQQYRVQQGELNVWMCKVGIWKNEKRTRDRPAGVVKTNNVVENKTATTTAPWVWWSNQPLYEAILSAF